MRITSLGSGSKGNSMYVGVNAGFNEKHFLIDAGLSMKRMNEELIINEGIDLEDIDLIFITHAHTDHVQSVLPIVRKYNTKIAMPYAVKKEFTEWAGKMLPSSNYVKLEENKRKRGGEVMVDTYKINHDKETFAYKITSLTTGESYMHIPDNGGIYKKDTIEKFKGCTYYAIESNHDLTMQIMDETRHEGLKRRVLGYYGHTHNADAFNLAQRLVTKETRGIIYHHLSEECNTPELAQKTHEELKKIWGEVRNFSNIKTVYALQDEGVKLV